MGYYITQRADQNFTIKQENIEGAFKVMKAMIASDLEYSWVSKEVLARATDIGQLFDEWSLEISPCDVLEVGGDINALYFIGDKIGSEDALFSVLAPFVEDGSFLEFSGEEGEIWRWVFTDGKATEVEAKIIWE